MRVTAVVERPFGSELSANYPRVANYITNPRFVTNTTGWVASGTGATITRDTAVSDGGVASLRLDVANPGASSDRAEYALSLIAGEEYIFRGRLRTAAAETVRLLVVDSLSTVLATQTLTGDGTFQSAEVRFTASANNTHRLRFGRVTTGAHSPMYGDKFQLIRVSDGYTISYADGSMLGYSWSGTADGSTTTETGWLEAEDPTDFEEEGGQLQIGSEIISYRSVDDLTGLIELPEAYNGIRNPSFETDLSRWSAAGGGTTTRTRDTTESWSGVASQKCVTDGTASGQGANYNDSNAGVRVEPGETWTAAGYFLQAAGGMSARITIEYKTAADVSLGIQSGSAVVLVAGRWTRLTTTAIAPVGAYKAYIRFINVNASAVTFFIDATTFERGSTVSDYQEGSLVGTFSQEDPIYVYPLSVERVAMLSDGDEALDDEDAMEARVPHALYDKLPVGLRDVGEGEAVDAGYEGDEFVVLDILGQEPTVDGSFLSPGTAAPEVITDGLPPTSSPAPSIVGGVRSLFVQWTPLINHDPVTYEVHVSTTSGFTPSGSTYAGEVKGSLFVIRTMPGTSDPPTYGTTYYVKLVAFDEDGAASESAEASGSPAQVDGNLGDVAFEGILAEHLVANSALFDKLQALLIITNTLKTGESGQRVEIDTDGIRLVSSTEQVLVDIPTDPAASPTFQGNVITGGLVVTGNALLQGENIVDQGSNITLLASVANPSTAPTLAHDWEAFTLGGISPTLSGSQVIHGLHYDPSGFGSQATWLTVHSAEVNAPYNLVETKASDGSFLREMGGPGVPGWLGIAAGVARVGSIIWVLAYDLAFTKAYLIKHDQADLSVDGVVEITSSLATNSHSSSFGVMLGTDDTDLLVLGCEDITGGSRLEVRRFNATTGAFISSHNTDISAGNNEIQPKGICSQGGNLWVYYDTVDGPISAAISSSTYALIANTEGKCYSSAGWGMDHDGTRFWTARFGNVLTKHTNWTWTTENETYWVGYTWRHEGNNTESLISPRASINMADYRRSRVKITRPTTLPGSSVDRVRVYALRNATSPATTALLRQDTSFITAETANPLYMFDYDTVAAAPPVSSSFGGAASGIKNTIGQTLVGSNWERYLLVATPFTKGSGTTSERSLVESANNLPNTVAPQTQNEVGATYEFELGGTYDQTTAGNLVIRVKIGTTVLESRTIAAPGSNQTNQGWFVRGHLVVKTTGATGTVNGVWAANFSGAPTPMVARGFNATDVVVDLTTAQRVDISAQFGASGASNGITVMSCRVQRIA